MRRILTLVSIGFLALSLGACNRSRDATDAAGATDTHWQQMKSNAEARWKSADTDGDDALSRTETAAAMPGVAKQFDEFDGNSDGKISRDEMHNFKMEDATG